MKLIAKDRTVWTNEWPAETGKYWCCKLGSDGQVTKRLCEVHLTPTGAVRVLGGGTIIYPGDDTYWFTPARVPESPELGVAHST